MSSENVPRVPYAVSPARYSVSHQMVTTAFELPNYRVVQNLGVVRGIVVRSRNVFATTERRCRPLLVATSPCGQNCASRHALMLSTS